MDGIITGKIKLFSQSNSKLFNAGLNAFQAGDYYEAHEQWEELWSDPSLQDRHYVHGLIQVAVALFHAQQDNLNGSRSMIDKALTKLTKTPDVWNSIKLNDFVKASQKWKKHVHEISKTEECNNLLNPKIEITRHA